MTLLPRTVWLFLMLGLGFYAIFANDGRHHWHEFRYLYSAANYNTHQLMAGEFDPGPAPLNSPRKVAEWYATEILHEALLRGAVSIFGDGLQGYRRIKLVYGILPVLSLGFLWSALSAVTGSRSHAALVCALSLISPTTFFLGFNFMGEVPAFFMASLAIWLLSVGLNRRYGWVIAVFSGTALAASALCSVKMPLVFLGFWVGLLAIKLNSLEAKRILLTGGAAWISFAFFWVFGFYALGGEFSIYFDAFKSFLTFTKHLPMLMFAVFNLGLFGMSFWIFAWLGLFSDDSVSKRFYLVWFAVSVLPVVLIGINFLEPRYLVTSVVPMAGLASLGLGWLFDRIQIHWERSATALASFLFLAGGSWAAQSLMPYEVEAPKFIEAANAEASSNDALLIPWNYSDFHFLRFIYPDRPVYLVQSPTNSDGQIIQDDVWLRARQRNYSGHFLPDAEALEKTVPGRRIYLGWTILPSLQNLQAVLKRIPFGNLEERFSSSKFLVHMTGSWLWQDPNYVLSPVGQHGQYLAYEVIRARAEQKPSRKTDRGP